MSPACIRALPDPGRRRATSPERQRRRRRATLLCCGEWAEVARGLILTAAYPVPTTTDNGEGTYRLTESSACAEHTPLTQTDLDPAPERE
jgi:hypothetical protein